MTKVSAVSGKKIVFILFAMAVTLAVIVFLVGLDQKHKRESNSESLISNQGGLIYSVPKDSIPKDSTSNDSNSKTSP